MITLHILFLVAAGIVFALATVPVASRFNLVALGLALLTLALIF